MTRGLVLYLDVRNARTSVTRFTMEKGTMVGKKVSVTGARIGAALAKASIAFRFSKTKFSCIAVATGGSRATRDVSWSGIRAGIAAANALGFAWGVPVVEVAVQGDETPAMVASLVREAAKEAKKGSHVTPLYDGEPNITTPKPR